MTFSPSRRRFWQSERRSAQPPCFLDLAQQHEQVMMRLAMRLWEGNRDAAEETVQDAIVSAYKAVASGQFSDFANFRPWILRIIVNAFHQEKRKTKRLVPLETELGNLEDRLGFHEDPLQHMLDPQLVDAIQSLGADQRACVLLVDLDGLEYSEAAGILGVPIGTVRSRLARARLRLAEILTAAEYKGDGHA